MPKKKSSKISSASKEESDAGQENMASITKKMPKKKSSKISSVFKEEPDAGHEKTSISLKKVDEIDNIFASKKRKKAEQEKTSDTSEKLKKIKKKQKRSLKESEALNSDSKPRRRTNDGLAIYSEEELRINSQDAGSTGLCPFDCSCCF